LKEIPCFLKVREIELHVVMHRDSDVSNIDDGWCERFMRDREYKIEHAYLSPKKPTSCWTLPR